MQRMLLRVVFILSIGLFSLGLIGCSASNGPSSTASSALTPAASIELPTRVEFHGISFSIPKDWSYEPYSWYLMRCRPNVQSTASANPQLNNLRASLEFFDRDVPSDTKAFQKKDMIKTEDVKSLGIEKDIGFPNEVFSFTSFKSEDQPCSNYAIYCYVGTDAGFKITVGSDDDTTSQSQIDLAYCIFQSIHIDASTFMNYIHDDDAKGIKDSASSSADSGSSSSSASSSANASSSSTPTVSQQNAVKKAKSYLNYTAFSYEGLVEQLEYEGFPHSDAVYGAEHSGADWMIQAERKAKSYMDYSAFSRKGLIDQLEYEGFTSDQAAHGADSVGL